MRHVVVVAPVPPVLAMLCSSAGAWGVAVRSCAQSAIHSGAIAVLAALCGVPQGLPGTLAHLEPLPVQAYMGIALDVEGERDQHVADDGSDYADYG